MRIDNKPRLKRRPAIHGTAIAVALIAFAIACYGLWLTRKDPNASEEQETVGPQQFDTKAELEEILKAQQLATKADIEELKQVLVK